jgi:hypothetical protein
VIALAIRALAGLVRALGSDEVIRYLAAHATDGDGEKTEPTP